jgi:hypothetical protein
MSNSYQAFGLTLLADRPIPGLPELPDPASPGSTRPDVEVQIELVGELTGASSIDGSPNAREARGEPWYESPRDGLGHRLTVTRRGSDGSFLFSYSDGTRFFVEPSGGLVRAAWPSTVTLEDVATYLLGPILGFVLRLHGVVCLHASGVVVGGRCVGILAPGGHGKSTIAAAFARHGHSVVTDDILVIAERGGRFWIEPAYPRLRLWPQSVIDLFGAEDALPRITPKHPTWDKRYLDLTAEGYSFQKIAVPLAVIYSGREDESASLPRFESVTGKDAFLDLLANSYAAYLLDRQMREHEFDVLGRVAETVPMRRFRIRRGIDQLEALREAISTDVGRP